MKNQNILKISGGVLLVWALFSTRAFPNTLEIGTKEAPPFSMKTDDGRWVGISIDLWEIVAKKMNLKYQITEHPLPEILKKVSQKKLDGGLAAISITSEREAIMDFTHPYYTSGLGIAVLESNKSLLTQVLDAIFSMAFFKALMALTAVLLLAGVLVWIFERKKNSGQFGGNPMEGLGSGFWWSAVTMTTVGYGDKSPVTLGGRIVGLVWMFASIIIISGFTAGIASSLTVSNLDSLIKGPDDLPGVKVGAIQGTTAESYLRSENIETRIYGSLSAALDALVQGKVKALVHDAPILQYMALQNSEIPIKVLRETFIRQDYGIALPPESPMREKINKVLLETITSPGWNEIKFKYLGR